MIELTLAAIILGIKYRGRISFPTYQSIGSCLIEKEKRYGQWCWGILLTGILMLALFLYVRPSSQCAFIGQAYAEMASRPFGFHARNVVPHRVLTSLISYLLGLRGQLIIITNLLFAAGLLYAVYLHFRKIFIQPADAFFASAIIAFSLVTINTVYYGGYNDSLSYLIIFLMWSFVSKRILFHVLFLLGLFNRESIVFLMPWLAFISLSSSRNKWTRGMELAVGFAVSLGLYFWFRHWLALHQEINYSLDYYLGGFFNDPFKQLKFQFPTLGLAVFSVFKVLWIIPLIAFYKMCRKKEFKLMVSVVLLLACAAGQLLIAFDASRMLTLGFLIMPVSLAYLFKQDEYRIRDWLPAVFLFNLFIPNCFVAAGKIEVIHSLLSYAISHWLR